MPLYDVNGFIAGIQVGVRYFWWLVQSPQWLLLPFCVKWLNKAFNSYSVFYPFLPSNLIWLEKKMTSFDIIFYFLFLDPRRIIKQVISFHRGHRSKYVHTDCLLCQLMYVCYEFTFRDSVNSCEICQIQISNDFLDFSVDLLRFGLCEYE